MAGDSDLRQFIRDIAARHERIWREQAEILREVREESREVLVSLRDVREESRAQTQALVRVLERLDNGGGAAA